MNTVERITALKELHALRQAEVISDEEFNRARKQVLGSFPVKAVLDSVTHILKPLALPVVVLIVLFSLKQPIISTLNQAEQVSVGSFSVKVRERAQMIGDPELAIALSGLSERAIELLMDTGDKNMHAVALDSNGQPESLPLERLAYSELEAKGLLSGPEGYGGFIKWATSLPGKRSSYFISETGQRSDTEPAEPHRTYELYKFEKDKLSDVDKQRLKNAVFTLSDRGRKLWRLLGKVVSEQLATH